MDTSFDNIVIASQPFYGMRIQVLLKKIEYLEQKLFWMRAGIMYSPGSLAYIHQLFISHNPFTPVDPENYPPEKLWKTEFEHFLDTHNITFAPGNALDVDMEGPGQIKLKVANVPTHLCSGINGNWNRGTGFGLLFFSKSREQLKYARIVEILLSESCIKKTEKNFIDHREGSHAKIDPQEMITLLSNGFDDHYKYIDNLAISCWGLYNSQIVSLRQSILLLELYVFFNIVNIMKWDINAIADVHRSKYNINKHIKEISWEKEFETLLYTYQLIVKPGKVIKYVMGGVEIFLNKETTSHICSGRSGNWKVSSNQGFGALILCDVNAQKRYLEFAKYVYPE